MAETKQPMMEYKRLGRSGVLVSEICLGAMTFDTKPVNTWGIPMASEKESFEMLNLFVEKGGNFIDTANVYGAGESEKLLGNWLQTVNRDSLVIATKVRGRVDNSANGIGLSRKHILASVEESLNRLQTHYIDLYQVHSFDTLTPLSETFRTLDDLVRCGKIRYIGISNFCGYQLQKAIDTVNFNNWEPIVCLQPQYNLLCRSTEWDLVKICEAEGLGIIPWSPLAGGILAGKFSRDNFKPPEGSRVAWAEKVGWKPTSLSFHSDDQTFELLDVLHKISKESGHSVAQISLRWLMQKPGVTAPIIGAKTVQQLKDNLGVLGWSLTPAQMEELNKASNFTPPYPWDQYWNIRRDLF